MMLTFDTFEPGAVLGTAMFEMDDDRIARWDATFPQKAAAGDRLPPGLIISIMMRGYIHILGERPDGNVHADQELHWLRPAPTSARWWWG